MGGVSVEGCGLGGYYCLGLLITIFSVVSINKELKLKRDE